MILADAIKGALFGIAQTRSCAAPDNWHINEDQEKRYATTSLRKMRNAARTRRSACDQWSLVCLVSGMRCGKWTGAHRRGAGHRPDIQGDRLAQASIV